MSNKDTEKLIIPIVKLASRAISDFNMIEDGDRIMVCLSGGKDSYTLLDVLLYLKKKAPINFEIIAVNLDQGQPNFPNEVLPNYLDNINIKYTILHKDTYSIIKSKIPEGKTTCSLCSRLRRGTLYEYARSIEANKIALGHHREDILETFFMNMFFGARLKAMPPKLQSDDGSNIIIRPLAYVAEADIIRYAKAKAFPIIPCDLCGSQDNLQRKMIGQMLQEWEEQQAGRLINILRSLGRITPSHLLDGDLYDFKSLSVVPAEGDAGFGEAMHAKEDLFADLEELSLL